MSCTHALPTADEAWRDIKLAAELEGLSVEELTRKGATIYARRLIAKRDALLSLLRPAPWRQFRLEDGGKEVSFRVRISTSVFAQALFIERNIRQDNGGGYSDDACEIAEEHMCSRLMDLPVKTKAVREARAMYFRDWLECIGNLEERLAEIEREVEHD